MARKSMLAVPCLAFIKDEKLELSYDISLTPRGGFLLTNIQVL